jgi:hypothetical protein
MRYLRGAFTLPSAPLRVSEKMWDLSVLTAEEFKAKYGMTPQDFIDGKVAE